TRIRSSPQKINRHAGQHDDETGPRRRGLINDQHEENYGRADDVERGHDRVTECFIRPLGVRAFPAEHENAENGQNVKDERGRNDVVEQVAVKVAVTGNVAGGVGLDRARQNERAGPNALDYQTPRGDVVLVQLADATEKETVTRHCIVSARAGEDQPVVAAECRNHDSNGHDGRACAGKDDVGGLGRHAVARRILDRVERKRGQIRNVSEQIKPDHQNGAERERERNVTTRIYDLAGGEGNVVPGVGGEKRVGLRHANPDEESENGRGSQSFANLLQTAAQRPEIAEVRRARARLYPDDDAEHNERDERARLRRCENILNKLAEI